jgi:hypothetical protein
MISFIMSGIITSLMIHSTDDYSVSRMPAPLGEWPLPRYLVRTSRLKGLAT